VSLLPWDPAGFCREEYGLGRNLSRSRTVSISMSEYGLGRSLGRSRTMSISMSLSMSIARLLDDIIPRSALVGAVGYSYM
jgi:hypothetical protein